MFNHRKKWLVNPEFQIKFTGYFTLCALTNFLLFIGATNWFFYKIQVEMVQNGISEENPLFAFISSQHMSLNILLIGMAAIGTVMMFAFGIWLSNKVAGPIYRVVQDLNGMTAKDSQKDIIFRKGDFFLELKDALNNYIKRSRV